MPAITTTNDTTPPVVYSVTAEELRSRLAPYRACTFDSPAAYRDGTKAIAVCRSLRGEIESTRKQLKAGALEYGRRVDSVAKSLVALVEETEEPLKRAKAEVDEAKERARRAKEEAERAAAEAKLRAERAAEEQRLAEERAAIDAERAALAAEREALEAERRSTEQARLEAERQEAARLAAEEATRLAAERAERQRIEAEEEAVREAERQAERARRREALRPDRERLAAYLADLLSVPVPTLADAGLQSVAASVCAFLRDRLGECEGSE